MCNPLRQRAAAHAVRVDSRLTNFLSFALRLDKVRSSQSRWTSMKICSYCGKECPDDTTVCATDGHAAVMKPQPKAAGGWRSFFGGGIPKLPLKEDEKAWIEKSFHWLLDEFGVECFLKHRLVLPEPSYFPDKYQGREEDVIDLVGRICGYMDVNPASVEVGFFQGRAKTDESLRAGSREYSGAAGLYLGKSSDETRKKIAINVSEFKRPTNLVATIAHELGHVILLGGGKLSRDDKSHEYLTDLITVFFGLGIFTANSAFQFSQWQNHSHQGWSASRQGYLSEELFAYSLALYAWMRGETNPKWASHLAMNVGHHFKRCLKYLNNGGQTSLRQLV